ncbi:OmpA family protein [Crocinitomix algicola]|uniref:OmpA family protein n=1 Tax=Crocinitomix algicola TaxID=1740263 RepID=UPI0008720580|nr:OmpA family protein [Crocinitomix algicola]
MKIYRTIIILIFLLAFEGRAQVNEIIHVEIDCETLPLENKLNSEANDFSPFIVGDMIYFSSDRDPDALVENENNWSKTKQINLYQGKLKEGVSPIGKVKGVRLVSEKFTANSHTGPACFSRSGDTLFVSKVMTDKNNDTNYPQLYMATKDGSKFGKLQELPFNIKEFSFAHPYYDSYDRTLYFASNKPGGNGGYDLYYSQLTNEGWEDPLPLIGYNSAGDDVFPFLIDRILFFASNGWKAGQDLDVYWKVLDTKIEPENLKGVNSKADDFGVFVQPGMEKGFFSSNRNGNDDLFYFDMVRIVTIRNEITGEFRYKNLDANAANVKVQVLDENEFVLFETTTNENGEFIITEVDPDKLYAIRADNDNKGELELTLKGAGEGVDMIGDKRNVFAYKKVDMTNGGTLALIPDNMIDISLNQGHLSGQLIYESEPSRYPSGMEVVLVDEEGNESIKRVTDDHGNFEYKALSLAKNYLLKVPAGDDDIVLMIFDLNGNVVAQMKTDQDGVFTYRNIRPDAGLKLDKITANDEVFKYTSQTIYGYFEYDNNKTLNREGLAVTAFLEDGTPIEKEITDQNGAFRFRNLPPQKNLLFKLSGVDDGMIEDDFTLYIYDRYGKKVAGLKKGQNGYFTFRPLGYDNTNALSTVEEDHLSFILGNQNKERERILVYFDSNQSKVKSGDTKILDNVAKVLKENPSVKVEINAYADSKATDEYNLILSGKRGDWIVDYFVRKGIDKSRFIVNAYGESKLVDKENDALNRRAEIHLY